MSLAISGESISSTDVARTLKRDFFLSFRFSQGWTSIQTSLYRLLGQQYGRSFSPDEKDWTLRTYNSPEWDNLLHVRPPADSHVPLSAEDAESDDVSRHEAGKFGRYMLDHLLTDLVEPVVYDPEQDHDRFVRQTISRDISWGQRTQGRGHGRDPHLSYFREYVILDTRTGSPYLDTIFDEIRARHAEALLSRYPDEVNNRLGELAIVWQGTHEGQDFWQAQPQV